MFSVVDSIVSVSESKSIIMFFVIGSIVSACKFKKTPVFNNPI